MQQTTYKIEQFVFHVIDAPLFVYIHGGFWQELDKETSAYCVGPLVKAGIRVIILDYDLCPSVTLEQITKQIERAADVVLNYATELGCR